MFSFLLFASIMMMSTTCYFVILVLSTDILDSFMMIQFTGSVNVYHDSALSNMTD